MKLTYPVLLIVTCMNASCDAPPGGVQPPAKPKTLEELRQEGIERQFNPWDGSHIRATELIKASMNDPNSYEHVKTTYVDGGDHLVITTTFRGKNAFGGVVVNTSELRVWLEPTPEEREATRKAAEEAARVREEKAAAIEAARWHTWTDKTGGFTVEARFSGYAAGTVKLEKRDGSTLEIPMDRLSEDDQAWIRERGR